MKTLAGHASHGNGQPASRDKAESQFEQRPTARTECHGVPAHRAATSPAESAVATGKAMSVVAPSLAGQASASVGAASLAAAEAGAAGLLGSLGPVLRRRTAELGAVLEQRAISDFNDWLVRGNPGWLGFRILGLNW